MIIPLKSFRCFGIMAIARLFLRGNLITISHLKSPGLKRLSLPSLVRSSILVGLGVAFMLPLPEGWNAGWRAEFLNRMHVPMLGVCCVALEVLCRSIIRKNKRRLLSAALSASLLAALVEIVQPWFHRTADMGDFMWGMAGIGAATLWNSAVMFHSMWLRVIVRVLAMVGLLSPPLGWTAKVMMARQSAERWFPVLTNFTEELGGFFWSLEPAGDVYSQQIKRHGQMILERTGQKAASAHLDTLDRDWTSFDRLEIDGTLEASAAVEVGLRLDLNSAAGPRLRAGAWMKPGRHQIQIQWPSSNLPQHVHQLVLFLAAGEPAASLQIHQLRLVPREDLTEKLNQGASRQ
ncbi:MAG: hypothetical protein WAW39_27575 [Prosthecobacter sp.]|uniref:hypothetical protein n=1 Tax=Prosthecobacter sp. TaxID=1965333 RepID=UPI003BAF8EFC